MSYESKLEIALVGALIAIVFLAVFCWMSALEIGRAQGELIAIGKARIEAKERQ